MKKRIIPLLWRAFPCLLISLLILGCQSTPSDTKETGNSEKNRSGTQKPGPFDAPLAKGMSTEEVRQAWGKPSRTQWLRAKGKARLEWLYDEMRWADAGRWDSRFSDSYGRPVVDYRTTRVQVPVVRARAIFEEDRLVIWETFAK